MDRTYKDIRDIPSEKLAEELLNLRVDHYMADPVMTRELLKELLEREVKGLDRSELIDELYDGGYWA